MKSTFAFVLSCCCLLGWTACGSEDSPASPPEVPQLMTVLGPISVEEMDTTLIHEHVFLDWRPADSTVASDWPTDSAFARILPFLQEAQAQGVKTLLECTPAYLGRNPRLLQRLAEASGMNLLTNTGLYGAVNNKYLPQFAYEATAAELASQWIEEFEGGIGETGIRPGFIKISVAPDSQLSDLHQKLVQAAAQTHLRTGLTIVSHTGPDAPALAQLGVLAEAGVAPEAFVWTHAQRGTPEGHVRAAQLGAWISIDNVNADSTDLQARLAQLQHLKANHLLQRVLISHDAGWYTFGEANGGPYRGYTDLFTHFLPLLKQAGFTAAEIHQLLILNPQRAYGLQVRALLPAG
jgi:phosphotriesterase-related protein